VSVEDLPELLTHEEVGLEFIFLFKQNVPQLVEVRVLLETKFFCAPSPTSFHLFAAVHHVACKLLEVLG
jgi:hypothetical protein